MARIHNDTAINFSRLEHRCLTMRQDVFLNLKKIPFFNSLPDEVLLALSEKARSAHFPKNAIILNQGDLSHSLHIILSGKVRVYVSDEENEFVLQFQEAGSCFGELALLTDSPRSASIMALEKTLCAVITQVDFMIWLKLYPEAASILLRVMAEKVLQLTDEVQAMALNSVYQRLVRKLKQLSIEKDGFLVIENIKSQEELANMIGTGREMVSKLLRQLVFGGYVRVEDKSYIILKKLPKKYGP